MSNWDNISSIINTGNVPFKPEHWENLSNRLDKIQLQDEKIREKLNEKKIVSTLGPGQYDP